jgi:hypothetical protein
VPHDLQGLKHAFSASCDVPTGAWRSEWVMAARQRWTATGKAFESLTSLVPVSRRESSRSGRFSGGYTWHRPANVNDRSSGSPGQ